MDGNLPLSRGNYTQWQAHSYWAASLNAKFLITQTAGTKTSFCWYGNQNINGMKTHANKLCTDVYAQIKIPIVYKCVFTCSQKLKNGDKVDHLINCNHANAHARPGVAITWPQPLVRLSLKLINSLHAENAYSCISKL